jgi:hypothetical protein
MITFCGGIMIFYEVKPNLCLDIIHVAVCVDTCNDKK